MSADDYLFEEHSVSDLMRLTPRQEEILLMYADGMTLPEIMAALGLARDTVKGHTVRLRSRMGARTMAHAVHLAHLGGILGVGSNG